MCYSITFGSALVTHTRCLTMLKALVLVAVCLARCVLNEGVRRSSEKQAITPAKYDERAIATSHNATTGEGGYYNTSPP